MRLDTQVAYSIANSVNLDQDVPLGAVWPSSACFFRPVCLKTKGN